ncbi:acyltransferase [Niallia oryzisoli]|uniref:Acyltransferase n=1 Tax=Niallia oryzisoli TaxID=1737571 RepID=A0ABZ2CG42_9BACI
MIKKFLNFFRARFRKIILEEKWLDDYIKMGMKVGENCRIRADVTIDYSHCWLIRIGNNVSISHQSYLLAHDASTKKLKDFHYTKIGSITIEDNVFIGVRAIIMPGVTIGKNSIVAAGSVVTKSIPENSIVAGNLAKVISTIDNYREKTNSMLNSTAIYDKDFTITGNISEQNKEKMYEELHDRIGFIV